MNFYIEGVSLRKARKCPITEQNERYPRRSRDTGSHQDMLRRVVGSSLASVIGRSNRSLYFGTSDGLPSSPGLPCSRPINAWFCVSIPKDNPASCSGQQPAAGPAQAIAKGE